MSREILNGQHQTWHTKPVLREIYTDYFHRMTTFCIQGTTLEVGGGSGNLKQFLPDVLSTDIVPTSWVDAAADAQRLPFASGAFANIVGLDILHHIEQPRLFLEEAQRTLQPGGRLILIEPAITPVSSIFYRHLHPEPVDMKADPLQLTVADPHRAPFDANQAIPTLLFSRHRNRLAAMFPELKILHLEKFSLLAYPLSGGFRRWSLIPAQLVSGLLQLENYLMPVLGNFMAFRLMVVIEKKLPSGI